MGDLAPVFTTSIRFSQTSGVDSRDRGQLAIELARDAEEQDPFAWAKALKARKAGRPSMRPRVSGSATAQGRSPRTTSSLQERSCRHSRHMRAHRRGGGVMSDLGQPRKAQHKASAFAGLLKPVAELAPETVPDPAPEQVPAEPVAIVEPSSKPADVAPSTTTTKSKRRAKSTTAPACPSRRRR